MLRAAHERVANRRQTLDSGVSRAADRHHL